MNKVKRAKSVMDLGFRIDTPQVLREVLNNQGMAIMKIPMNELQRWLQILAQRATELNDPELNVIMLSMNLYETPYSELTDTIQKEIDRKQTHVPPLELIKQKIQSTTTGRLVVDRYKEHLLKIIDEQL